MTVFNKYILGFIFVSPIVSIYCDNLVFALDEKLRQEYSRVATKFRAKPIQKNLRRPRIFLVGNTKSSLYFLSNLQGVSLRNGSFDRANFTGANLQGTLMQSASLKNANLFLANLQDANLSRAKLNYANLTGANLQGAVLEGAQLEGANLYHANLQSANFYRAQLQGVVFVGANLQKANLRGVDLSTVVGLTQEQLNRACVDDYTILQENLSRPGPCRDHQWDGTF